MAGNPAFGSPAWRAKYGRDKGKKAKASSTPLFAGARRNAVAEPESEAAPAPAPSKAQAAAGGKKLMAALSGGSKLSPNQAALYKKLMAKGMNEKMAMALAKRAKTA